MKKIILFVLTIITALFLVLKPIHAYENYTVFSDYTDFPAELYNSTPKSFNVRTTIQAIDVDLNTRNVQINLTLRNDEQKRLYIDIELYTIGTSPIIQFNYTTMIQTVSSTSNMSSIGYSIQHGPATFNQSQLEIGYSIGGFDGTYEYLSGTIVTSYIDIESFEYQYISQDIEHNFTLLNEIYNYGLLGSFDNGYQAGQQYGYNTAKGEYGWYDGNNWITATVHGNNRYNTGLNEARNIYGFYDGTIWLTADQYGDITFDDGYQRGLNTEIDWFSWSMTFFLMPFRIMNIEVLPGVKIGYFALFSLLLGIVGWFFFIVGKGGGRKK